MAERCLPDILVIEETKLDKDFKKELFVINNYEYPMLEDRKHVRKGVVCNRITVCETQNIESICQNLPSATKGG